MSEGKVVRLYKWKKDPDLKDSDDETEADEIPLPPLDESDSHETSFEPPDLKFPDLETANESRRKSRDFMRKRGAVLEQPQAQRDEEAVPEVEFEPDDSPAPAPSVRLYSFVKRDRSTRVRWLLEELAVPFEQEWLDPYEGDHLSPEYLELNPFGRVPVLQLDDVTLYESGAIMTHLLEAYPDGHLMPSPESKERPFFWQWFHWGLSTLDSAVIDFLNALPPPTDMDEDHGSDMGDIDPGAFDQLQSVLVPLEEHLERRTYLLRSFSAADIVVGHMLGLLSRRFEFDAFPAIRDYLHSLLERPAAASFLEGLRE